MKVSKYFLRSKPQLGILHTIFRLGWQRTSCGFHDGLLNSLILVAVLRRYIAVSSLWRCQGKLFGVGRESGKAEWRREVMESG